jgi:hypothetical protein
VTADREAAVPPKGERSLIYDFLNLEL